MHLLLRQAEITARDMAVYWMLNDEESKTKDDLNSRITRYMELKNKENEVPIRLVLTEFEITISTISIVHIICNC